MNYSTTANTSELHGEDKFRAYDYRFIPGSGKSMVIAEDEDQQLLDKLKYK